MLWREEDEIQNPKCSLGNDGHNIDQVLYMADLLRYNPTPYKGNAIKNKKF